MARRKSSEQAEEELHPELAAILAPRETRSLFGHTVAEARLAALYHSGRMPHALLITGPVGVGKASLSYLFGKFVLSNPARDVMGTDMFGEAPPASKLDIDPDHSASRHVACGQHGNLYVVHRELADNGKQLRTVITVDQIRQLSRFFRQSAAESGYRIALVDRADQMNESAANALLKLLEEPPPQSLLLLLAQSEGLVPATIRSRCQILKLRPLQHEEMREWLRLQSVELDDQDSARLTDISDGAPGRAAAILAQDGMALYHQLLDSVRHAPDFNRAAVHKLADQLSMINAVPKYNLWMDLFDYWLQRMIRLGAGVAVGEGHGTAASHLPPDAADSPEFATRLMATRPLDRWLALWEKLSLERRRGERLNLDRKQLLVNRFFHLAADGM